MTKARILLGLLMVGIILAGVTVRNTNWLITGRVITYAGLAIMFTSALIIMSMSDKNGQIRQGTILYLCLRWFYGNNLPEKIRLCPMYWTVVPAIALLSEILLFSCFVIYICTQVCYYAICTVIANPSILPPIIGNAALTLTAVYVVWLTLRSLYSFARPGNEEAGIMSTFLMVIAGLYWMVYKMLRSISVHDHVTMLNAAMNVLVYTGKIVVVVVFLGVTCTLFVLMIVKIAGKIFPWVKTTMAGQVAAMIFGNLCPTFTVEKIPITKSNYL